MEAYEFQTALNDGIIRIPAEFRNKISGNVKVILIQEKTEGKKMPKKPAFPYFAVDTTGYVFDREEANER